MASYNGVQAAVLSRPGCRSIFARSLLTSKNTRMAGGYPRSYSQVLCEACQHWGVAGGSIVVLVGACRRRYLWAVLQYSSQVTLQVHALRGMQETHEVTRRLQGFSSKTNITQEYNYSLFTHETSLAGLGTIMIQPVHKIYDTEHYESS